MPSNLVAMVSRNVFCGASRPFRAGMAPPVHGLVVRAPRVAVRTTVHHLRSSSSCGRGSRVVGPAAGTRTRARPARTGSRSSVVCLFFVSSASCGSWPSVVFLLSASSACSLCRLLVVVLGLPSSACSLRRLLVLVLEELWRQGAVHG